MSIHKVTVQGYTNWQAGSEEWCAIRDSGRHHFNVWGNVGPNDKEFAPKNEVTLKFDDAHMFTTQLVTINGQRVHDWADYMNIHDMHERRHKPDGWLPPHRYGHYVVNIDELREIRKDIFKCGYCGKHYKEGGWCHSCITSEYLRESSLYLLRLLPLYSATPDNYTDTDEVPVSITSNYARADYDQTVKYIKEQRAASLAHIEVDRVASTLTHAFYTYALTCGIRVLDLKNCIYYKHTNTFCFGWSNSLSDERLSRLQKALPEYFKDAKITYK